VVLRVIAACLLGCALGPYATARIADRGPSTPAERKQALEFARHFEADPLNPDLNAEIQWVLKWTMEVPDIRLDLCTSFDKLKFESKDGHLFFDAMVLAQTGFVLEHPDRKDDGPAQTEAGAEGVLRAYEASIKANPKDREPFLDKLFKQREAGTLSQFIKQHAPSSCGN